jgi:quinol monooxygenase YgiN
MIHSIVATLKIKPGAEDAFEAIARKLVAAVNTSEPGCMLYTLNKGDDPQTYAFMERYRDEEAVKAHRASEHYRTYGKEMGPHLDGAPAVLRMREVS